MNGRVAKRLRRQAEAEDEGKYQMHRVYGGMGGDLLKNYAGETYVLVEDCVRGRYLKLKKEYKRRARYGEEIHTQAESAEREGFIRRLLARSGRKASARNL